MKLREFTEDINKIDAWKQSVLESFPLAIIHNENDTQYAIFEDEIVAFHTEEGGFVAEASQVWAKSGNKIVKKYRCTSGTRKGRIVSNPKQCSAAVNIKARQNMKKLKAKLGKKMARKAKRTKKNNPVSRQVRRLNRR